MVSLGASKPLISRKAIRIFGAILLVVSALGNAALRFLPRTSYIWDHVGYDKAEYMGYPREAISIKIQLDRIGNVQGNVTFFCGLADSMMLVPKFYVFRTEEYGSISPNVDWVNLAVYRSGESFSYEAKQNRAVYVRNFAFEVKWPDEYFFVLLFPLGGGTGKIDLYRQREVRLPFVDIFLVISTWTAVAGALITLGLTVLGRRRTPYSARHIDPAYQFDISIRKARWLPLYVEQWLVPRFVLEITNKGKGIDRGEIDCEFVAHDEVSSFPVVTTGFKDFTHIQFQDFKKGETLKNGLKIESRFIKPRRYMIRVIVSKWELAPSDHYDLFGVLAKVVPTDHAKGKETAQKMQEIASAIFGLNEKRSGEFEILSPLALVFDAEDSIFKAFLSKADLINASTLLRGLVRECFALRSLMSVISNRSESILQEISLQRETEIFKLLGEEENLKEAGSDFGELTVLLDPLPPTRVMKIEGASQQFLARWEEGWDF